MALGGMCKDCVSGVLHDGTPTGRIEKLFGLDTYIAEPESGVAPKGIIVIGADAFGWELVNNRILADEYAKKGNFRVYLPDFFAGHALTPALMTSIYEAIEPSNSILKRISHGASLATGFPGFLFYNRAAVTGPRLYKWFYALRHSEVSKGLKVGIAGFCWGGKYTFYLCSPADDPSAPTYDLFKQAKGSPADAGEYLVDAGFTAHPSLLELPLDAENVTQPLSIAHATKDMNMAPAKASLMISALDKKNAADGAKTDAEKRFEFVSYEGATHGFAVRNNPYIAKEKEQGEQAEKQAIDWFTRLLAA